MNNGLIWTGPPSDSWETPPEIFDPLNREFRFTLDAAASARNAKCARFFTELDNGLEQDWSGHVVWVNPPYSKGQLAVWTLKASYERKATVVMLLPAFTDQKWFHLNIYPDYLWGEVELRFFKGRIKFLRDGVPVTSPRFASMLAIWRVRD